MSNTLITAGYLGDSPSIHKRENGEEYARFRLADNAKNKDTGDVFRTDWHTVFTKGETALRIAKTLTRGEFLKVKGRLSYRSQTAIIDGESRTIDSAVINSWDLTPFAPFPDNGAEPRQHATADTDLKNEPAA